MPGRKEGRKIYNKTYVNIRTFPYNISQNLIGHGVFTLTHSCKTLSQVYVKLDRRMIYLLLPRPVSKALSKLYLKIVTCFSPS